VSTSDWSPHTLFAKSVYAAGFEYDPEQDIIYSRMNPTQRRFGYGYAYDDYAIDATMNIDCEPIFFNYKGKLWMIELWKGQYGIETGAEIGLYNCNVKDTSGHYATLDRLVGARPHDPNPYHAVYFDCVTDKERLEMEFTLKRDGEVLLQRGEELHWWLTGFKWGVYSEPEDLTMDVSIKCADGTMRDAFRTALQEVGYTVHVSGNTVSFTFDRPFSYQPRYDHGNLENVRQLNQNDVAAYNGLNLDNNDPNDMPPAAAATAGAMMFKYRKHYAQMLSNILGDDSVKGTINSLLNLKIADFSCTVQIDNLSSEYGLSLDSFGRYKSKMPGHSKLGHYSIDPPPFIGPGQTAWFSLQDDSGIHGAEGWCKYQVEGGKGTQYLYKLEYRCPTGPYDNVVKLSPSSSKACFYASSGKGADQPKNHVPKSGHPLWIRYVFT
jgi:hypothetical protein